jgi:hypothetical protein
MDSVYIVTPSTLYFNATPGQVVKNVVQVENKGASEITLTIQGTGIKIIDAAGHIRKNSDTTSKGSWIYPSQSKITLAPKEQKFVSFEVRVPETAQEGSHSIALSFIQNQEIMKVEKGTVVHVDIGKAISTKLSLIDFKQRLIPEKLFNESVQIQLVNSGVSIGQPNGVIKTSDIFGRKLSNTEVTNIIIPPQSSWSTTYEIPVIVPGIYHAEMELHYNHGLQGLRADTWLLSPSLLFLLGLSAIVSVIVLFFIHHKRKWKRRKK